MPLENHPKEEDYRSLISNEWKDIHHSRIQEWSALGVITASHVGIFQLIKFIRSVKDLESINEILIPICCILALGFSIAGILMTCRHRRLMWIKFKWILACEDQLGLIKDKSNPLGIIPKDKKIKKSLEEYKKRAEKEISEADDKSKNKSIWDKLKWPRRFSTSWIIVLLYILIAIIDIGIAIISFFSTNF